jgi:transcriptional regulator with XRE-family HTH domain
LIEKEVFIMLEVQNESFGNYVKKKLIDIGMKQIELAERTGVSEAYISEILNDKKEGLDIRSRIIAIINEKGSVSNGR